MIAARLEGRKQQADTDKEVARLLNQPTNFLIGNKAGIKRSGLVHNQST
jgi:hypothetical protein